MIKHKKKQEDLCYHESQRLRIALVHQTSEKAVQQEELRGCGVSGTSLRRLPGMVPGLPVRN